MKNLLLIFAVLFTVAACTPPQTAETVEASGPFSIGPSELIDLAKATVEKQSAFEFDAWGEYFSDDIEYNFPDGNIQTRTKLVGKAAFLNWWKEWGANSGVNSFTLTDGTYISVASSDVVESTGMDGNYVLAWLTCGLQFDNGNNASFRMNYNMHFNDANKIDRVYSYYDRTGIIEAMQGNVLNPDEE